MHNLDEIRGKGISKALSQLQKGRVILKLNVLGADYERLTIVTDIRTVNRIQCFFIDYPAGFRDAARTSNAGRVAFEYAGKNNLQYTFRAVIKEITEDGVCMKFPDLINRLQRRKYFRMAVPLGTKIYFLDNAGNGNYQANVVDVSLGGVLLRFKKGKEKKPSLYVDEYLRNIRLTGEESEIIIDITIKKAVIKRVVENSALGSFDYALQFIDIGKNEKIKLDKYIYNCQRELLKKMSLMI